MSTHTYSRKSTPSGKLESNANKNSAGDSLYEHIVVALPGKDPFIHFDGNDATVEFTPDLTGAEVTTLDSTMTSWTPEDVAADIRNNETVKILHGEFDVTSDGTFEEVAAVISRPEAFGNDPAQGFGQVLGGYAADTGAGDPKYKVIESDVDGANAVDLVPSTSLADTSAAWAVFNAFTPVGGFGSGYKKYRVMARLNGATSLKFQHLNVSILEVVQ